MRRVEGPRFRSEEEREGFLADAVRRAYVGGGLPNLAALTDLLFEPHPPSTYASADEIAAEGGNELHAIGVYEAHGTERGTDETRTDPSVEITVLPTPRRVDLFLMSSRPVVWRIRLACGARLGRIWLGGRRSSVAPPWRGFRARRIEGGPNAYCLEGDGDSSGPSAAALLAAIAQRAGRPVASFQGSYSARGFRVPFYRDALLLQSVLRRCSDHARSRTAAIPAPVWVVERRGLTQLGGDEPALSLDLATPRAVARCEADGRFYVIDDQRLYAVSTEGAVVPVEGPSELSWLGGITYDSRRRRIVLSTHWHTGYHHLFDPLTRSWDPIPIGRAGGPFASIAYEPARDLLYGLRADPLVGALGGRAEILVLSPDLQPIGRVAHTDPLPFPASAPGPISDVQLAAFEQALAILIGADDERGTSSRYSAAGLRLDRGCLVRLDRDEIQPLDLSARVRARA